MTDILGIIFLVIFSLTALITLASLPNWIHIDEKYKKPLFTSLILEVVGAVVILFSQTFLKQGDAEKQFSWSVRPNVTNWVAYDLSTGKIFQPGIYADNDSLIQPLGLDSMKAAADLARQRLEIEFDSTRKEYRVLRSGLGLGILDGSLWGNPGSHSREHNVEIEDFFVIRYEKDTLPNAHWKLTDATSREETGAAFIVKDTTGGTFYRISQDGYVWYSSRGKKRDPLSSESRENHFFQDRKDPTMFHFFRIIEARNHSTRRNPMRFVDILHLLLHLH